MSRATKRKHVLRELLEERVRPGPRQRIVRVLGTPGNNLHEVETAEGTRFLASMPPRFRRHIWIKRGDFLLVDPIEEGAKVKAEMSLVLLPPHVRFLQRQGLWPEAFAPQEEQSPPGDGDLFVNTNRAGAGGDTSDTGDTSDEEDSSDTGDTGDEEEDAGDKSDTTDKEEDRGDEEDTGDDEEDAGDNEDTRDSKDTGDKKDMGDKDTGDKKDMGDKDTHPKDSGDKDRGDGGPPDAPCPPQ